MIMVILGFGFFSCWGSSLCVLHFWVWSFVWTLVLPFSSLVPLPGVCPLFIYLFYPEKVHGMLQVTTSVG
jgi:hypothetical protein